MHDIDRTQLESPNFEHGQEFSEFGEVGEAGKFGETAEATLETPRHETRDIQLATELLEVTSDQELEQFLGNVFSKVGSAVGSCVRSDTGRAGRHPQRRGPKSAAGDWPRRRPGGSRPSAAATSAPTSGNSRGGCSASSSKG
jgi:hypothetical protein